VQSVYITIKVMSSNPAHGDVYSMQHDITEILLKVALNTITLSIESSEGKEYQTEMYKIKHDYS
jgi:hypothetical protein